MADLSLFNRLRRLFSSDVIIRNIGGNELKVIDTNKIQKSGKYQTNSLLDRFSRLYVYNNRNIFNPNLNYQTLRIQLYSDYEAMDTDPIIASALDVVADECLLRNDRGDMLTITSSDENVRRILNNLFYDVLNVEFNLWSWVRGMLKYGDFFLKLEISEKFGIYNVLPYSVYHISRFEGADPENPTKVYFTLDPDGNATSSDPNYIPKDGRGVIRLENYEVAHFRLLTDTNYLPYGRSYIEPARKIYKQLTLTEDAALIHRIMRAPEKRTFYINVGQIPPNEVENFMQKTINTMKKTPYVGADGQYNLRFNMQNMMEDFYIPVRGGDNVTRVETTPGLNYDGITDIRYYQEKLFSALKIPKAYLGYEGELCVVPETEIPLLDGTTKTVADLIQDHENGIQNYTYSIDEKTLQVVPGKIEWAGWTRKNAQIVRVWLDNEQYIDTTPDHLFMTRDGEWIEAQNLTEGTSLMPWNATDKKPEDRTVTKVEFLEERRDTCDIRIEGNHNFATAAGVFIHNSGKATLSAEDIRFARTVERVQRIVESELTKIAIVHLYTQGFTGESLSNFKIKLTTPSVLFEQEKIALLKEKVDLAGQMLDTRMFSTDYIYESIFGISEEDYSQMRNLVREDAKRSFRVSQIENEGNDPAKSGKSYGTPHDLASMYGRRSSPAPKGAEEGKVPVSYEEEPRTHQDWKQPGPEGGRPRIRASFKGTQKDPVGGSDRYGQHELHGGYPSDYSNLMEAEATGSHNVDIFDDPIRARMLEDSGILEREPTMLKESNIAKIEGMLKRLDIPDKLVNRHSK